MSVQACSPLVQNEGERKVFFGRCKKGFHIVRLPQEHLVIIRNEKSLFARLEIILHVLCFLLDPFAKNHCRTWSSTGVWQGYLKCSIWGTNNQLPNIFYNLFIFNCLALNIELFIFTFFDVNFFFSEKHVFCKQKRMAVYVLMNAHK